MIDFLKKIDIHLFLSINGGHNSFLDVIMYWASHKLFWIPLYLIFLFLIIKTKGKKAIMIALSAGLLIVLSDQISVIIKKNILRYRPCHNLEIQNFIHLYNGHCGGQYGFVSSHAANCFALATFLSFIFPPKGNLFKQQKYFSVFVFSWASLVAYSRVYLGVHYPADVLGGALLGISLGFILAKTYFYFDKRLGNIFFPGDIK